MRVGTRATWVGVVMIAALGTGLGGHAAVARTVDADRPGRGVSEQVRFATFNASLNRDAEGQLLADLSTPNNPQARKVAEVIQRTRPDVLLVNERGELEHDRQVIGQLVVEELPCARPLTHPHDIGDGGLDSGGQIPPERVKRSLQILTHEVMPAFK
jgi:hypothetical protein